MPLKKRLCEPENSLMCLDSNPEPQTVQWVSTKTLLLKCRLPSQGRPSTQASSVANGCIEAKNLFLVATICANHHPRQGVWVGFSMAAPLPVLAALQ